MTLKQRLMARNARQEQPGIAERIARAIEASVCEPGTHCADRFCVDCIEYRKARADAAIARRIGKCGESP
jgi:hypothetical protein